MSAVRIAISAGDPAGIGPEVVLRACHALFGEGDAAPRGSGGKSPAAAGGSPRAAAGMQPVVYGDERQLNGLAQRLGIPVRAEIENVARQGGEPVAGRPQPEDAQAALAALVAAVEAVERGDAAALVTAPVSKEGIAAIEPSFRGHTEYLAARAGVRQPLMVFAGIAPAVALLTTHLPLALAVTMVRRARIAATLERLDAGWQRWFDAPPRIGVAGLNPHAGEHGLLGWEDDLEVGPGIADARRNGVDASGPYPADSIFRRRDLDVVLALYHDQGTIMAKNADAPSVNTTLGLPYPRTSPDHGVAYDIAGRYVADPSAMIAAIELAGRMAARL